MLLLPLDKILELKDCYYIPNIVRNIISVPLLLKQGFEINIENNGCSIYLSNNLFGMGKFINGLLNLSLNDEILLVENKKRKRDGTNETFLWHCRLGHINESRINKLYKDDFFGPYDYKSLGTYESCLMGKMTKSPFFEHGERATELLGLIQSDVCGPMTT